MLINCPSVSQSVCDFYEEDFEDVTAKGEELEAAPLPVLVSKPRKK